MNIEYLEDFLELARTSSFTRTASRRGISRSALSKHISALEQEFRVRLFERDNLHTRLTSAGELLLDEVQKMLAAWANAHVQLRDYRLSEPMSLKVGVFGGYKPIDDLVATAAANLLARGVQLDLSVSDVVSPGFEALRAGEFDVFPPIYPEGTDLDGLDSTPLFSEPLVAIVSTDHPLASHEVLKAQDLTGNVVWSIDDGAIKHYSKCVEQVLMAHGARPKFVPTPYRSWRAYSAAFARVNSGIYVTFASTAKFAVPLTASGYRAIPFDDDGIQVTIYAVRRADDTNPASELFVNEMASIAATADMSRYWA